MHWVDDINSKFYNQLIDITKVKKDWNSSEHLIEYPKQYEYAIEIKTNPKIYQVKEVQFFYIVVQKGQQQGVLL